MSFISTEKSDFTLENIPFGIISTAQDLRLRPATAIGDFAVDLKILADAGAFQGPLMSKYAIHVFSSVFHDFDAEYFKFIYGSW
jgi:fumarylacetoacetase